MSKFHKPQMDGWTDDCPQFSSLNIIIVYKTERDIRTHHLVLLLQP